MLTMSESFAPSPTIYTGFSSPSTRRIAWRRRAMSRSMPRAPGCPRAPSLSSGRAHLADRDDAHVETAPLLERCAGRFADLIGAEPSAAEMAAFRSGEAMRRPLGGEPFLDAIQAATGRDLRPKKRGRKKKGE